MKFYCRYRDYDPCIKEDCSRYADCWKNISFWNKIKKILARDNSKEGLK